MVHLTHVYLPPLACFYSSCRLLMLQRKSVFIFLYCIYILPMHAKLLFSDSLGAEQCGNKVFSI